MQYPADDELTATEKLHNGTQVEIRAVRPTDQDLERHFIESLSPDARRHRFLCSMRTPSDALLKQLTDIDLQRDAALIALNSASDKREMVGAARFTANADGSAEIAVVVSDAWQLQGLGTALLTRLVDIARRRGIKTLFSADPEDNNAMRAFARRLGFERTSNPEDLSQVIYTLNMQHDSRLPR